MGLFKILSDPYSVFAKQVINGKPPQKLKLVSLSLSLSLRVYFSFTLILAPGTFKSPFIYI